MLASVRSFNGSLLGRAIFIACVTIAFSYIFFEVLDLDGSNFRTHRDPVQIIAIVPAVETDVIRSELAHRTDPGVEVSFFSLAKPIEWVHRFATKESVTPILNLLHRCGYRTALPRSSIPDDFPIERVGVFAHRTAGTRATQ
jgi:hypothetical protein